MNIRRKGVMGKLGESFAAGAVSAIIRGSAAEERPQDVNLHLPTAELSEEAVGGEVNQDLEVNKKPDYYFGEGRVGRRF